MKQMTNLNNIRYRASIETRIKKLTTDLIGMIDHHLEGIDQEELFFHCIKILTLSLYKCIDNHQQAYKILRLAMDDGIKTYIENKK